MKMKGTEAFVQVLKNEGVDLMFAYPGGYAVDIFNELYDQDDIEVVLPRHEQGRSTRRTVMPVPPAEWGCALSPAAPARQTW